MEAEEAQRLIARDWEQFSGLLAAGGPGVWERPTRLAGWRVLDLARHAYWGMTLEAEGLRLAARSGTDGPGGEAGQRAAGRQLEVPAADTVAALQLARAELLDALEQAPDDPGVPVPMPYGDLDLGFALQVFVMEAAVHRSDLAHAVGADDRLAPGTAATVAVVLQAIWPVLATAAATTPPEGTGFSLEGSSVSVGLEFDGTTWRPPTHPPDVVVEGDDDTVLLVGYGRLPVDDPRVRIHGQRDLALRLKEFVPGP